MFSYYSLFTNNNIKVVIQNTAFLTDQTLRDSYPHNYKRKIIFLINSFSHMFKLLLLKALLINQFVHQKSLISTLNICFQTTHYPFRITYLPTQIQVVIVYRKTGFKRGLKFLCSIFPLENRAYSFSRSFFLYQFSVQC